MSIFIFRSVWLYLLRWANAYQNQASLLRYRISFWKRFGLQTNSCISCTAEAKVLFKVCLWVKILLSIASSTSQCSAQNLAHLGLKATNRRRDSFPSGHDQVMVSNLSNVHCLPASTSLVVYKKPCYPPPSISITIGQFSSNRPGWSSRTEILWEKRWTISPPDFKFFYIIIGKQQRLPVKRTKGKSFSFSFSFSFIVFNFIDTCS